MKVCRNKKVVGMRMVKYDLYRSGRVEVARVKEYGEVLENGRINVGG